MCRCGYLSGAMCRLAYGPADATATRVAVASAGPCKSAHRSRQITTPAPPPLSFFTGRMPFLPPSQQRQSTEGLYYIIYNLH